LAFRARPTLIMSPEHVTATEGRKVHGSFNWEPLLRLLNHNAGFRRARSSNGNARRICCTPGESWRDMDVPEAAHELPPVLSDLSDSVQLVMLHIYDVTQQSSVQWLNTVFANEKSPMKFGGIFHVGVEVHGVEYSFGYAQEGSGICWNMPKQSAYHHFRETVEMGMSQMTVLEFGQVIKEVKSEYRGDEYNLLTKNCCHFADDICQRLKLGKIPSWVHRLATLAGALSKLSGSILDTAGGTCCSVCINGPLDGSKCV